MKKLGLLLLIAAALVSAKLCSADDSPEQKAMDSRKQFGEAGSSVKGTPVKINGDFNSNTSKAVFTSLQKSASTTVTLPALTTAAPTADASADAPKPPPTLSQKIGTAISKGMDSFTTTVGNIIKPVQKDIVIAGAGALTGFLLGGPIGAVIGAVAVWLFWKFFK